VKQESKKEQKRDASSQVNLSFKLLQNTKIFPSPILNSSARELQSNSMRGSMKHTQIRNTSLLRNKNGTPPLLSISVDDETDSRSLVRDASSLTIIKPLAVKFGTIKPKE